MPGLPSATTNARAETIRGEQEQDIHPVQPHSSHPSHFQFPRTSLHQVTLLSHFHGPHAAGSVDAPKPSQGSGASAWFPATDIRESMRGYHIEIETPGITDENKGESVMIQWMSPHTLLVQGVAVRPRNVGLMDQQEGKREWEGNGDGWAQEAGHGKKLTESTDGGPIGRTTSRETIEAEFFADRTPTILLSERKVGAWRRTFTLPEDVEMKELKARLEGGLLRIDLPKRSVEDMETLKGAGVKIEIE